MEGRLRGKSSGDNYGHVNYGYISKLACYACYWTGSLCYLTLLFYVTWRFVSA